MNIEQKLNQLTEVFTAYIKMHEQVVAGMAEIVKTISDPDIKSRKGRRARVIKAELYGNEIESKSFNGLLRKFIASYGPDKFYNNQSSIDFSKFDVSSPLLVKDTDYDFTSRVNGVGKKCFQRFKNSPYYFNMWIGSVDNKITLINDINSLFNNPIKIISIEEL